MKSPAIKWIALVAGVPVAAVLSLYLMLEWLLPSSKYQPPRPLGEPPEQREAIIREAFQVPPKGQDLATPPGLLRFFVRLNVAEQERKPGDWADLFDANRLVSEAKLADLGAAVPTEPRGENVSYRVREALKALSLAGGLGLPEHSVRIMKIVSLPGRVDAIVCTRHDHAHGSAPFRWWMTHREGEWQAYDVEDVRLGLRLSEQLGYQLAAVKSPEEVRQSPAEVMRTLREAANAIQQGKLSDASEKLHSLDRTALPRGQRVVAELIEANLALVRRQPREVLAHLDTISSQRAGVAVVHYLHACAAYQQQRFDEAIRLARSYQDSVGLDPEASSIIVGALLAQGHPSEANRVFDTAIREFPESETLKQLQKSLQKPGS